MIPADVGSMPRSGLRTASLVVALVLPALLWAALLPGFGRLPANDYWGILAQVVAGDRFSADALDWLDVKSNEHTVVLPALIYAANVSLTAGDNRMLSAIALLLLLASATLLFLMLPIPPGAHLAVRAGTALVLSAFIFTPAAAHSIVLGFSGTIWFLANLLAIAAVHQLVALADRPATARLAGLVAIGLLGALSYSTNLALWPALLVGTWLLRVPVAHRVVIALGGVMAFLFVSLTYARPAHHPPPDLTDPAAVARFLAVYLGSPLAADPWLAGALGVAGLMLALLFTVLLLARRDERVRCRFVPWFVFELYAVGNGLGTAIARAQLGGARSSRYVSVAVLFWVGLAATAAVWAAEGRAAQRRSPNAGWVVVAGLALLGAAATWWRGLPVLEQYLERAARQPLAELALQHEVADDEALAVVTPLPQEIRQLHAFLVAARHVPFDRPATAVYGAPADCRAPRGAHSGVEAARISAVHLAGEVHRVEFAWSPAGDSPDELLVVDGGGTVRGAVHDVSPAKVWRLCAAGRARQRWAGYVVPGADRRTWLLCAAGKAGQPTRALAMLPPESLGSD
jgi:hypothetical protein